MRWAEATWPERAAAPPAVLLVPLGATEQHGPHLPLDTDTRIATAVAERVAARHPGAVVAPAVPYGASGEHQSFPGTLSIGTAALTTLLVELIRSATGDRTPGPDTTAAPAAATDTPTPGPAVGLVVLVNGHGGNADAVRDALAVLRTEGRPVVAWWPRWPSTDSHAGRVETSLLLAIAAELVHLDRAAPGATAPLADLLDDLRRHGVVAVAPNGVLGDPTGASAAEGVALLEDFATDLDRTIHASLDGEPPPPSPEAGP